MRSSSFFSCGSMLLVQSLRAGSPETVTKTTRKPSGNLKVTENARKNAKNPRETARKPPENTLTKTRKLEKRGKSKATVDMASVETVEKTMGNLSWTEPGAFRWPK